MKNTKEDSYIVLKRSDLNKLTESELEILNLLLSRLRGHRKPNNYYVVNTDEPYAKEVLNTILIGEKQKRPSFETLLKNKLDGYLGHRFKYDCDINTSYETRIDFTIEYYPLAEEDDTKYFNLAVNAKMCLNREFKYSWCLDNIQCDYDSETYKETYKGRLCFRRILDAKQ